MLIYVYAIKAYLYTVFKKYLLHLVSDEFKIESNLT